MPYRRRTTPTSTGTSARKIATACRRASPKAACSDAGLIGTIAATDSSSANISAMRLRKASAFRFGMVARCADRATRIKTSSADGAGNARSGSNSARTTQTPHSANPPHTSGPHAPPNPAALAYEAIKPPAVGLRNTHASVEA